MQALLTMRAISSGKGQSSSIATDRRVTPIADRPAESAARNGIGSERVKAQQATEDEM